MTTSVNGCTIRQHMTLDKWSMLLCHCLKLN